MIGIFDSGVGGLGIFNEIRKLMPDEPILYLADSKNCPYGDKTEQQIKRICLKNTKFLIKKGADTIVVACNTGSTIALEYLRSQIHLHLRGVTFVGVVPVVKTCSEVSKNKRIGILATKATVNSPYLRDLVNKFCSPKDGFKVYYQAANELVELVEKYEIRNMKFETNFNFQNSKFINIRIEHLRGGRIDSSEVVKVLQKYLQSFIDAKVDVIALSCTHFPFLRQQIEQIMGDEVRILDSNGAVARQVERIAYCESPLDRTRGRYIVNRKNNSAIPLGTSKQLAISDKLKYQFFTTGDSGKLRTQINNLIGLKTDNVKEVDI